MRPDPAMRCDPQAQSASQTGFSLVDVLIASVMVTIGLGAVLSVTAKGARLADSDRELSLALQVCRNGIEQLRSLPAGQLPLMDGKGFAVPGTDGNPGGLSPLPEDDDGLPGRIQVTLDQEAGGSVLYRVTIEVDWLSGGMRRRCKLLTLMGQRGHG